MRKLFYGVLVALTLVALTLPAANAQELKIGVFDPARISSETEIGKRVQAELSAFRDGKQAEISSKEQKINTLQQELQQQELSLSNDRRSTMEREIQRQMLDLQSSRETASRELQLEVNSAQASFEEKLIRAVEDFGRAGDYLLVIDRGLIAWADASTDVTDKVVARFNEMYPATSN